MVSDFKIVTFNSTGMAPDRIDFIKHVTQKYRPDVLFLQETWLIESRKNPVLRSISDEYQADGVAAFHENDILIGRPKGGLGIMWKKSLGIKCKYIPIPNTNRTCAIQIELSNSVLVLINVYMPTDNYSKSHVNSDFLDTCDAVEMFVQQCSSSGKQVVIGGDLNLDMSRKNAHDLYFKELCERYDLVSMLDIPVTKVDYTYHDQSNDCFTCIDHFCVGYGISQSVTNISKCDEPLNPSNHSPLLMSLTCSQSYVVLDESENDFSIPIAWHKVNDLNVLCYQQEQQRYLKGLCLPPVLHCVDPDCKNIEHKRQIDMFCEDLINCCIVASETLPRVSKCHARPKWSADVKPYKDDCIFWHKLWVEAGSPKAGVLYDIKKHTKRQYMYANRRNKRRIDANRKEKMAVSISSNNSRDFFKEFKRYEPKKSCASIIDGKTSCKEIADVFADKYRDLFNCVPSNDECMKSITDYVEQSKSCGDKDRVVTLLELHDALTSLKHNKSDGDRNFMSNHLLLSGDHFLVQLSLLFTSIFTHGYHPKGLLIGTIESIPKDCKGNVRVSSNYRGITLCNSIQKLMDIIIMRRYEQLLLTSNMQYAFKQNHSTVMCTLVLKEVVKHYANHNTDVYSCYVDASKAFDRVRYDKLFTLLMERGMPPIIVRSLLDLYTNQLMRTRWRGQLSETFSTTNGIRQGGVISPVLFCIYIDELLLRLADEGSGCWVGKHFFGALGYADDLTLLSPSVTGLRTMLQICQKFAEEYSVKYNGDKTVCMIFSKKDIEKPIVELCGIKLKWVQSVKHLGTYLDSNMSEITEIFKKKHDLVQRVNYIVSTLGNCSDEIVRTVFNSKCAHFYGCQSWNLSDRCVKDFQVMWNRCVRRILKLPNCTHTKLLPILMNTLSAYDQIQIRIVKIIQSMLVSKNAKIKYLAELSVRKANSTIGANIQIVCRNINCDIKTVIGFNDSAIKEKFYFKQKECDILCANQILEIRHNVIPGFNDEELSTILTFLCTD